MQYKWTEQQLDYLRLNYADTDTRTLMAMTGKSEKSVYQKASEMGLRKSKEYLSETRRHASLHPNSIACQFRVGHVPFNKGKKEWQFRSKEAIERCARTQFKKGGRPHNTKPVGYESLDKDGYVLVKVSMGKPMVQKHRWVWKQAHGDIPRGYNVMFRDGNRLNCSLDNLELVSRSEAARRQVEKETPEQRMDRIKKTTKTRNELIRRDRIRIHWGFEPKSKLVKKW
jgi:transcriptional antiterminator Rof (Rho-off)